MESANSGNASKMALTAERCDSGGRGAGGASSAGFDGGHWEKARSANTWGLGTGLVLVAEFGRGRRWWGLVLPW